jgi:hypothetical protein
MESCPHEVVLEERNQGTIMNVSLTDMIKQYENFVVLIFTK